MWDKERGEGVHDRSRAAEPFRAGPLCPACLAARARTDRTCRCGHGLLLLGLFRSGISPNSCYYYYGEGCCSSGGGPTPIMHFQLPGLLPAGRGRGKERHEETQRSGEETRSGEGAMLE